MVILPVVTLSGADQNVDGSPSVTFLAPNFLLLRMSEVAFLPLASSMVNSFSLSSLNLRSDSTSFSWSSLFCRAAHSGEGCCSFRPRNNRVPAGFQGFAPVSPAIRGKTIPAYRNINLGGYPVIAIFVSLAENFCEIASRIHSSFLGGTSW